MTTDTDPRVQHAIELAGELRHDELAALKAYLAAEFAKVPSAPVEAVPLTQTEHEVMWRAMRRAANIVRPSADEAMSRRQFEAFHAGRKNRGAKRRSEMFNQLADGTYADESESRHWWTWQTAVAFALDVLATGANPAMQAINASAARMEAGIEKLRTGDASDLDPELLSLAEQVTTGKTENEIDRLETEVARLTAELQEVRRDAWQPIETAPKDGSEFIAWWVHPGGPMGAISTHWLDNTNTRTPWAGWRAPSMRVMHPGGKPTHWMPLPKAPDAAMTKEKPCNT